AISSRAPSTARTPLRARTITAQQKKRLHRGAFPSLPAAALDVEAVSLVRAELAPGTLRAVRHRHGWIVVRDLQVPPLGFDDPPAPAFDADKSRDRRSDLGGIHRPGSW